MKQHVLRENKIFFNAQGGIALLESVDAIMTGVGTSFVVLMELICLLYVYRSRDFQSDMHVATEDNTCASRIEIQWQIIPFVTLVCIFRLSKVLYIVKTMLSIYFFR